MCRLFDALRQYILVLIDRETFMRTYQPMRFLEDDVMWYICNYLMNETFHEHVLSLFRIMWSGMACLIVQTLQTRPKKMTRTKVRRKNSMVFLTVQIGSPPQ